ncbi:VWA domain-containing protein [Streptomyces phaeochromogenes]|uniref:vWA domain-containing protein n=1 Tax=Streptomyces phaeochromogenes TaxID=1923 RepID=UPI0033CA084B
MSDPSPGTVLPVYIAADESSSMQMYTHDLNSGLAELHTALLGEPMAASKVRIAVVGFANMPVLRLPLTDLRDVDALPELQPMGMTCYGTLFEFLTEQIPHDVASLKAESLRVMRPVVFFMTDGMPTDDWRPAYRKLTDRQVLSAAPHIIACGIGGADASVMADIASTPEFGFIARETVDLGSTIGLFFSSLTRSVVASATSIAAGIPELVVERPEGFRMAIDEI